MNFEKFLAEYGFRLFILAIICIFIIIEFVFTMIAIFFNSSLMLIVTITFIGSFFLIINDHLELLWVKIMKVWKKAELKEAEKK